MNPSKSPEDTIKSIFPILLVLVILIAGVIVMPTITADPRSRASEPKVVTTPTPLRSTINDLPSSPTPEIICSELYSPVCDTTKNITYPNSCEANLARASQTTKGECSKPAQIPLPASN